MSKKVIEQDFFLYIGDIEISTDTDGDVEILQWNKERECGCDIITVGKSKAREVALAISPELESELAEKDKEIERFAIGFAKWIRENGYGYSEKFNLYQKSLINKTIFFYEKELIELYKQSLNK